MNNKTVVFALAFTCLGNLLITNLAFAQIKTGVDSVAKGYKDVIVQGRRNSNSAYGGSFDPATPLATMGHVRRLVETRRASGGLVI